MLDRQKSVEEETRGEKSGVATRVPPLPSRLAHEIPRPKDWPAFQRNCVILYQAELRDPNAQEYGRNGQDQRGIDILGKRNGNPDHYVGVQCRKVIKPLKEAVIMKDCREALGIKADLKEIIFATTAPDDTHATDAAVRVESTLRGEGFDLGVTVLGWGAMQTKIALHETAYAAFCPSFVASQADINVETEPTPAAKIAAEVVTQLRQAGLVVGPVGDAAQDARSEDPALNARIDVYRSLFKDDRHTLVAEQGLLKLLESEPLEGKPWAHFRIQTILGSIAIDLGREEEGAERFEEAHRLRPDDANAVANLALAHTIRGHDGEAMASARRALELVPHADHAVCYLLQAAARSDWQGDPETLIPPDLVGSVFADVGLAEFLRRRNCPDWAKRSLELSRRHPDAEDFKQIRGLSVLALLVEGGMYLAGEKCPVSADELKRAADEMKSFAWQRLENGFGGRHDMVATLNNAAVLLRFSERHQECEALLTAGLKAVPDETLLVRLLALTHVANGNNKQALKILAAHSGDAENQLLMAELVASEDPNSAISKARAIDADRLGPRLDCVRWQLVGDLSLRVEDAEGVRTAIEALRSYDADDPLASILEIRSKKAILSEDAIVSDLLALANNLPADTSIVARIAVAEEMRSAGLAKEACAILKDHVDLSRLNHAALLYLQCLAASRQDEALRATLEDAAAEFREAPDTLWTLAAHAWNTGHLPAAAEYVEKLLAHDPEDAKVRLLKIEILIRQNNSTDLFAELDKPIEELHWPSENAFRVASLLGHFGYLERAASLAYRLYLEHRDQEQAWMTFCGIMLGNGRNASHLWTSPVVAPNVAVDLKFDDGEKVFFVVEPSADLRKLDAASWEPEHALVNAVAGLAPGARFVGPGGREGEVVQLRYKYVARFHYLMEHYEKRFPTLRGLRRLPIAVGEPDGLAALIETLKARHDWIQQEQEQYLKGPWPLGLLAFRVGVDTIDAAFGLAAQGLSLKVAVGTEDEREAAFEAVRQNGAKGCILDLATLWTAWELQGLDAITSVCGPVHIPRSVMDRLLLRREKAEEFAQEGFRTAQYHNGKILLQEIEAEATQGWLSQIVDLIAWVEANATICPLTATSDLPEALRLYLQDGYDDILDSLVLAFQKKRLLVSDDLPTREIGRNVGLGESAWLHIVFGAALERGVITSERYVRVASHLIGCGHSYLGIAAPALALALRMDAKSGKAPGPLFQSLTRVLGGSSADVPSHIRAALFCLRAVWEDNAGVSYREPATGLVLHQVLRERWDDYKLILATLRAHTRDIPALRGYIVGWARGHFLE